MARDWPVDEKRLFQGRRHMRDAVRRWAAPLDGNPREGAEGQLTHRVRLTSAMLKQQDLLWTSRLR